MESHPNSHVCTYILGTTKRQSAAVVKTGLGFVWRAQSKPDFVCVACARAQEQVAQLQTDLERVEAEVLVTASHSPRLPLYQY